MPIDILGSGVIVAPPSAGAKGAYRIIQGSLDDLANLPLLRNPPGRLLPGAGSADMGRRNAMLFRYSMAQARFCDDLNALLDCAQTANANLAPPLPDAEVVKIVRSAWGYESRGANWFGAGQRVVTTHAEVDGLMLASPDAFLLLMLARRRHWGREFVLANAMAEQMPGGGWSRKRFAAARRDLVRHGAIEMVSPASRQLGPAIYRFKGGRF